MFFFFFFLLPVGIWPETLPTIEQRSRSPRNTEKSVSMFKAVAVRESVTVSPPLKVFFPFFSVSSLLYLFLQRVIIPPVVMNSAAPFSFFLSLPVFSLFASYGLSRTPHFVSRGVQWGSARDRERERERVREGELSRENVWRHKSGVYWKIKNKELIETM